MSRSGASAPSTAAVDSVVQREIDENIRMNRTIMRYVPSKAKLCHLNTLEIGASKSTAGRAAQHVFMQVCVFWYFLATITFTSIRSGRCAPYLLLTRAQNEQFIYNLSERGLVKIFSDRGLLQYYGEEYDDKFYPYKDSNALQRLHTSSPEIESLLCVQILPGYGNLCPSCYTHKQAKVLVRFCRPRVLMFDGCYMKPHVNRKHAEIQKLIEKYGLREEKLRTMSFNGFHEDGINTAGCVCTRVNRISLFYNFC